MCLVAAMGMAACEPLRDPAVATPAGETPDHRAMWRLDCEGMECDAKAREQCGGSYMTLSDSDVATGSATVVQRAPFSNVPLATTTITGHRAVMIVCNDKPAEEVAEGSGSEREAEERQFVSELSQGEPEAAQRCDYWTNALEKPQLERLRPRVRTWIKGRIAKTCGEPE
jgi:hypothetical protein